MIRPTSAPYRPCPAPVGRASARQFGAAGFTLVELLVVIGIIVLLVSILLPVVNRAFARAERARVATELNAIGSALEAYKQDFGYYPDPGSNPGVPSGNMRGANILCRALIAPGHAGLDGAAGPGFRALNGGKIWNAYLPADQFKVGDVNGLMNIDFNSIGLPTYQQVFILDRFKKPILYYRAQGSPTNIRLPNGFVAANPSFHAYYDSSQNSATQFLAERGLRAMLGDMGSGAHIDPNSAIQPNGSIDGEDVPAHTGPYLLWSAGPDEKYGPQPEDMGNSSILEKVDVDKCDDITNFRS